MEGVTNTENWQTLRERINEQLTDCCKHSGCSGNWGICARLYKEVLKEMDRIEGGTQSEYAPFNGVWHTNEEIAELSKNN